MTHVVVALKNWCKGCVKNSKNCCNWKKFVRALISI